MGPAWTRGEIEKPQVSVNKGPYSALEYSAEQQQRLAVDAQGNTILKPATPVASAAPSAGSALAVPASAQAAVAPKPASRRSPFKPLARGSLVAVTGASGFIGSHIVQALLAEGYNVRACVRDGSPSSEKNQMLLKLATGQPGSITLVNGELDKPGSFDEAFAGCAAVVHSAAVVDIQEVSGPYDYNTKTLTISQVADPYGTIVKPAVDGTRHVLASAVASGSVTRFVMTSSCIAVQMYMRHRPYFSKFL